MHICSNPDCQRVVKVIRKTLCNSCYCLLRRNGKLGYKNPDSMIGRAPRPKKVIRLDHPLYYSWKFMKARNKGKVDERWMEFESFIQNIPPKGSDRSSMARTDESLPWGPDNFYWREPILSESFDFTDATQRSAYSKARKEALGFNCYKDSRYKSKYGISIHDYNKMVEDQEGKCASCRQDTELLAVDHDHRTGKIRGLLDNKCNSILGHANDSIAILVANIKYLDKHSGREPGTLIKEALDMLEQGVLNSS